MQCGVPFCGPMTHQGNIFQGAVTAGGTGSFIPLNFRFRRRGTIFEGRPTHELARDLPLASRSVPRCSRPLAGTGAQLDGVGAGSHAARPGVQELLVTGTGVARAGRGASSPATAHRAGKAPSQAAPARESVTAIEEFLRSRPDSNLRPRCRKMTPGSAAPADRRDHFVNLRLFAVYRWVGAE